ncbi:putative N-acetylmuramoyl-L-alanine amidase [Streptomyces himastatinicus ATCC 53653]|uniref:Putative N-acetylmuramoyl-L-alanine amidase n=1 Tax=Streptomyces himastatinicus ATCC 53653 TaxID=457427 RepID=D9WWX0_9ACTN|nr:peptidoglycan-binding protein [Streptomyces himastatinicus]EFL29398.1 putative N-acetylmuramoyl-L-alanine amidase [Streptomyces himastatinicus ATCC 53653]
MAKPLSAAAFLKALRDEGLKVVEVGSWRTHNRNSKGAWGPMHGVMIHHTVTRGTQDTVDICRNGHASLPGPLCHGVIAKDGTVYLVGYGRANHAGLGDDDVLQAVIDERPVPTDNEANTDGNARFYGFECENLGDGKDPWPAVQLEAIEKAAAALCRAHDWGERSVIGHLEWQPGKVDPRGFTMASMRARVKDRLGDSSPGPSKPAPDGSKPAPKPTPPRYEPFPGASFFHGGRHSAVITAMGRRLVAEGCGAYRSGPGPNWTNVDRESYRRWQKKLGYTGSDADGIPGKASWDKLRVPNV